MLRLSTMVTQYRTGIWLVRMRNCSSSNARLAGLLALPSLNQRLILPTHVMESRAHWCGEFEVPVSFAASSLQELQIQRPHHKPIFCQSSFDSDVRIRGRSNSLRTSESELWTSQPS